jgi:hypothetical protein
LQPGKGDLTGCGDEPTEGCLAEAEARIREDYRKRGEPLPKLDGVQFWDFHGRHDCMVPAQPCTTRDKQGQCNLKGIAVHVRGHMFSDDEIWRCLYAQAPPEPKQGELPMGGIPLWQRQR